MPRFFTGEVRDGKAWITGEDARHMALSLRMKPGEAVTVCDGDGMDYQCVIDAVTPQETILSIQEASPSQGEPKLYITLYQAMPKGDKMELIIQKAVELGVGRIVPVLTHRCVSRPDAKAMEKKLARYNKIAAEAAKQCGRGRIPAVLPLMGFEEAVAQMRESAMPLFFYENADRPLREAINGRLQNEASVLIGSEGGFEPSEAQFASENGLLCLSLGNRVLRCETAPLAALAALLYEAGEV